MDTPELKVEQVKGRIRVLKALPYKDCMVYIRQIDGEIFMYDLVHKNQIYSAYLVMKPAKDKKKLTETQISQSGALIMAGAMATIDMLRGDALGKTEKGLVKTFEEMGKKFFPKKKVD